MKDINYVKEKHPVNQMTSYDTKARKVSVRIGEYIHFDVNIFLLVSPYHNLSIVISPFHHED